MKLRARLLAAFAVVLAVSAGVALLVVPIPTRDRLLAFGIIIVVGLVVAFAVAEMLARPLGELSDAASRVARGDLSARAHARTDDEVGALRHASLFFRSTSGRVNGRAPARDEGACLGQPL